VRRRARQDITSAVAYYRSVGNIVRIGSKKHKAQVVDITARRREVEALVKFIDAHGGRPRRLPGIPGQATEYLTSSDHATSRARLMTPTRRRASARKRARCAKPKKG
jgi:pyruvate/2-oxoglutarate dehydrogenase complex dihydrolipoamide dehydrogenase (E3) component